MVDPYTARPWTIQVYALGAMGKSEWRELRPTHGVPYTYATREQAQEVLRICYPESDGTKVRLAFQGLPQ